MAEIHTYPEMNAKIKDLLRIGEQPICLYAAKRIEELEEYERKKGKWIWDDEGFHCSECLFHAYDNTGEVLSGAYKYCPLCGSELEVET